MQSLAVTAVATSRMHTSLSRGRGWVQSLSGALRAARTLCKRRLSSRLPSPQLKRGHEFGDLDVCALTSRSPCLRKAFPSACWEPRRAPPAADAETAATGSRYGRGDVGLYHRILLCGS